MTSKPGGFVRKRPCAICRRWFQPDVRVGDRQRVCAAPSCQRARKRKQEAGWRRRNPDYFTGQRWQRATAPLALPTATAAPMPRSPPPLDQVPWDVVQTQFEGQQVVILALIVQLILRALKRRGGPIRAPGNAHSSDMARATGKRREAPDS